MNIFSDLLQRKSRTKPIQLDFMSFKQTTYESVDSPTPKTLITSVSSNSLANFNVRDHYLWLKEQARRRYKNNQDTLNDTPIRKQSTTFLKQTSINTLVNNSTIHESLTSSKVQRLSFLSPVQPRRTQQLKASTLNIPCDPKPNKSRVLAPSGSRLRFLEMQIRAIGRTSEP